MKDIILIHKKKRFVFRKMQEDDVEWINGQFGSLEEFQKRITDFTDFDTFAESLVRAMHHLLIRPIELEEFKSVFYDKQEDIAALYYKFGPCIGVTKKQQKESDRQTYQIFKLRKENRKLKGKLFLSECRNFKEAVIGK